MGEPQPGDFPDSINVKTANVLLKATQIGSSGDYVRYNSSGTAAWEVLTTTLITAQGTITGAGLCQLQQSVDSTGIADAVANAACFGPGSWFYGLANGTILPNALVMLGRIGTQFGFRSTRDNLSVSASVTTNVITINCTAPHHLKVGDEVITTGFTPTAFNATLKVLTIVDFDSFTASLTTADAPATVQGLVTVPVTGEFAHAQFIKKSGATYSNGAILNDTCIFSMLTGGQPVA